MVTPHTIRHRVDPADVPEGKVRAHSEPKEIGLSYVRHVLDVLRISPRALALKAGVYPSTITRALNDPAHKFVLSTTTLQKIAAASGINPAPFLTPLAAGPLLLSNKRVVEVAEVTLEAWARELADAGRDGDAAEALRVANGIRQFLLRFPEGKAAA